MIVNQVQRSLQPPLRGLGHAGLGYALSQEPAATTTAPEQSGKTSAGAVIGALFVTAIGFGAVAGGAYLGAQKSPKWAAGGAVIGNLAATGLLLLTSAIAARGRQG